VTQQYAILVAVTARWCKKAPEDMAMMQKQIA
jgi:hypothetical protein